MDTFISPPRIQVLYGAPIVDRTEQRFLARLMRHLERTNKHALVLANFEAGPNARQIDFVVVTENAAVMVEVKGYRYPVTAMANGRWTQQIGTGSPRAIGTPAAQAITNRFCISDLLRDYLAPVGDPRSAVQGMLCMFPEPPVGSSLPNSTQKLVIGGFATLTRMLGRAMPGAIPLNDWRTLARALGMEANVDPDSPAAAGLADFRQQSIELLQTAGGPFLQPDIMRGNDTASYEDLLQHLVRGERFHLVGPSGAGKTRLLDKLAEEALAAGLLAIVIPAREFEGGLLPMLKKAAAKATAFRFETLVRAADQTGTPILLCLDALNECPHGKLADLLAALQTVRLRFDATILLTAQELPNLPASLAGVSYTLLQPAAARAKCLTEAHLGRALEDNEVGSVEIVATAQDASVLARALQDQSSVDGRLALYRAFTLNRLLKTPVRLKLHAALGTLASELRKRFASKVVAASAAHRLGRAVPDVFGEELLEQAVASQLLISDAGAIRFRHDLIADYFAAEDMLRAGSQSDDLIVEFGRPFNAALREFLLGAAASTSDAQVIFASDQGQSVMNAALHGRCGASARRLILDQCRDLLERIADAYSTLRFEFLLDGRNPPSHVIANFTQPFELSPYETKLVMALPVAVTCGLFGETMTMLARIDAHLDLEASRLRQENPDLRRNIPAMVYGGLYGTWLHSQNADLMRTFFNEVQSPRFIGSVLAVGADVRDSLDRFEEKTPGQLFLLLSMFRNVFGFREPLPTRMAPLIEQIWRLKIYHLTLLMTNVVHFGGHHSPEPQRLEIFDILQSYLSDRDPWMNMILLDAIRAVGELDFGLDIDAITADFAAIAERPVSVEGAQVAMAAYTSTYDHHASHIFHHAFYERLTQEQRIAVLVRAAGDPLSDSFGLVWVVRDLARQPDPAALEVLAPLAVSPKAVSHSVQSAVLVFAEAVGLLARLGAVLPPVSTDPAASASELAWLRVRPLIYSFNATSAVSHATTDGHWHAFQEVGAGAAMDVLMHLMKESRALGAEVRMEFQSECKAGLRILCLQTLQPEYCGTSLFDRFQPTEAERRHREFALEMLGTIGRTTDRPAIERWLEDQALGGAALDTLRSMESG